MYAIHFLTPGGDMRSFQYVHLDSNSWFTAERITLVFMRIQPVRVIIEGRNLWPMYYYIHQHRMLWVMVAASDFVNDWQAIAIAVKCSSVKEFGE